MLADLLVKDETEKLSRFVPKGVKLTATTYTLKSIAEKY